MNGNDLIKMGFKSGAYFKEALIQANIMEENGSSIEEIKNMIGKMVPNEIIMREDAIPVKAYINDELLETEDEINNIKAVQKQMQELAKVPTIVEAAIMPDTCPAGTVPVGCVLASKNTIHPGFHSADICCSLAASYFENVTNPEKLMDIAMEVTHFGMEKRVQIHNNYEKFLDVLTNKFKDNQFLNGLEGIAHEQFMTQRDGNHFLSIGHLYSSPETFAIVTHHGSRNLGAKLYKRGMDAAIKYTKSIAPKIDKKFAWLDFNDELGKQYWEALILVRQWTWANHFAIHDEFLKRSGNKGIPFGYHWNEHNFVFRRKDKEENTMFYHAKGATQIWKDNVPAIIPLNMAKPILIVKGSEKNKLGFAPHGAGRNVSRTQYMKDFDIVEALKEVEGLDIRAFNGNPDYSEYPSAYKDSEKVVQQMLEFDLCDVTDMIIPHGTIMAGKSNYGKKS